MSPLLMCNKPFKKPLDCLEMHCPEALPQKNFSTLSRAVAEVVKKRFSNEMFSVLLRVPYAA